MELRDFIVTPIILALIYLVAYIIRLRISDQVTRRYFFPALTVRIIGALALGFIYQFYYSGGDTFNYHTHGSRVIWDAFIQSPSLGFKLFMNDGTWPGSYSSVSKIFFFHDPSSFTVIQIASFFDVFTFSSYSATAIIFAVVGFTGSWLMYFPFYQMYPHLHKSLAFAVFFIPSVIFWGSGVLKDTITYACVGMIMYSTYNLFIVKKISMINFLFLIISVFFLYRIKVYILITFVPAMILWVFFVNLSKIRNKIVRVFAAPMTIALSLAVAVFAALKAGQDNPKYAFDKIAQTAQITAYDIRYWTGKDAGSGYSLGELDGTFASMAKLAPKAIVVSLFRPYLWEVKNPLMLISAIEAFVFMFLFVLVIVRSNFFVLQSLSEPSVIFCLAFSIVFAFAVGVSTFNFGTLVRYKIPMLPFFVIAIILIDNYSKRKRIERLTK